MYYTRKESDKIKREEKFKQQLFEVNPSLEITGEYINMSTQIEFRCLKCGEDNQTAYPQSLIRMTRKCARCEGKRILIVGHNDYATTHPNHTLLLKNPEEAKTFTFSSKRMVKLRCPICGTEKTKRVVDVTKNAIACPKCGDGFSYPNKFMWNLLSQLKINFDSEVTFGWSQNKRYDFLLGNNLIEMDGAFHKGSKYKSYVEVKEIDELKDKLAIDNGYNIIRIECYQSDFEYIKNNILDSSLSQILELDKIDWIELEKELITNNLVKVASTIFNEYNGIKNISEMAKMINLTTAKFSNLLKTATRIGLTDYNAMDSRNGLYDVNRGVELGKECICLETGNIYSSCKEAEREYDFKKDSVGRVCRGERLTTNNLHFDFVETTEEIQNKKKSMQINKDKPSKNMKRVMCVETGIIYASASEASRQLGMGNAYVNGIISKGRKTPEGYTFKYV